jgi:probable HAF family extracellular repeat protein
MKTDSKSEIRPAAQKRSEGAPETTARRSAAVGNLKFLLLALISCWSLAVPVAAPLYHVTDLGTLGGFYSEAEGISPGGLVTGFFLAADGVSHLFLYDGVMHDLGAYHGTNATFGTAINDHRQIAGYYRVPGAPGDYPFHALFYDGTNLNDIGTLGGSGSTATGINAAGRLAGWSYETPGSTLCDGFLYYSNALHALGGYNCDAVTVDDSNRVVGYNYIVTNSAWEPIAFINDGTFHYLGTLGGDYSMAVCINPSGRVVGESTTSGGATHGFFYDGAMHDLGTLGGGYSSAYWLNRCGDVCGVASVPKGDFHGFLYTGGVMYDLDSLLDASSAGWVIAGAWSMNDAGQIAGTGFTPVTGHEHAVMLTPCPQLIQPGVVGANFSFWLQTVSNAGYTIEYNDDLGTTNWSALESLTGDGSLMPCLVPMTNGAQRFFRVRQP